MRVWSEFEDRWVWTTREDDVLSGVLLVMSGLWLLMPRRPVTTTIPNPLRIPTVFQWMLDVSDFLQPYIPYLIGMFLCLMGYRLIRWNWEEDEKEEVLEVE
jgi:hypothetical protein